MEVTATWRAARSVGYVFGALGAQAAPGTILVRLLADLGIQEPAARTALSRMTRAGQLGTERHGRVAVYRPIGTYREQFRRVRRAEDQPSWSGGFMTVVYDIEERHRRLREDLRALAFAAGFGSPRPGLLIGLSDPAEWLGQTEALGPGFIAVGELRCEVDTARRLAARSWPLADLVPQLEGAAARIRRLRDVRVDSDLGAFQLHHHATAELATAMLQVPGLPAEIAPAGWPIGELWASHGDVSGWLWPAAAHHVATVRATVPEAELVEYLDGPAPLPRR